MKLQDIPDTRVVTLKVTDTIEKAVSLIDEHNVRHLPVVGDDGPEGMISDRDLLSVVGHTSYRDLQSTSSRPFNLSTPVSVIMSSPVHTLAPEDDVARAARLMLKRRVSAVPLVCGNCVVGIVTETDLLNCYLRPSRFGLDYDWRRFPVSDYMRPHVFTMCPQDTVASAFERMRETRIRHLPIVENEELVGIISERDIRKSFLRTFQDSATFASEGEKLIVSIMNRNVQTLTMSTTLAEVAEKILNARLRAFPVLEDGKLVGIITSSDLIVFVALHEE